MSISFSGRCAMQGMTEPLRNVVVCERFHMSFLENVKDENRKPIEYLLGGRLQGNSTYSYDSVCVERRRHRV